METQNPTNHNTDRQSTTSKYAKSIADLQDGKPIKIGKTEMSLANTETKDGIQWFRLEPTTPLYLRLEENALKSLLEED